MTILLVQKPNVDVNNYFLVLIEYAPIEIIRHRIEKIGRFLSRVDTIHAIAIHTILDRVLGAVNMLLLSWRLR